MQSIVKEIIPRNKDDYNIINKRLEKLKEERRNKYKQYDIIEKNERIFIVIDNNEELLFIIDKLILFDELDFKKESVIQGHNKLITKEELLIYLKWRNQWENII